MASFVFSQIEMPFDLSDFAIFFMDQEGTISYACPVLVPEQKISMARIHSVLSQVDRYQQHPKDKEFLQNLLKMAGNDSHDVFIKLTEQQCQEVNRREVRRAKVENARNSQKTRWVRVIKVQESRLHVLVKIGNRGEVEVMVSGKSLGEEWSMVQVEAMASREQEEVGDICL